MHPHTVDDKTFAFGAANPARLLPKSIPDTYRNPGNPWCQAATRVHRFGFGPTPAFQIKKGVTAVRALRPLGALLASPLPEQGKIPAVAAVMEEWFEQIYFPESNAYEPEDIPRLAA